MEEEKSPPTKIIEYSMQDFLNANIHEFVTPSKCANQ
jgi:hypothetical protein